MKKILQFIAFAALVSLLPAKASAQADGRQLLAALIQQMQTGTPNAGLIGQQLWFTISQQTGGTGYYPQLAQLGPVTGIQIQQQMMLPQGPVFAMTAQHQNGYSTWQLGFSHLTGKIEYASVTSLGNGGGGGGGAPTTPPPNPLPDSGPDSGDNGGGAGGGTSAACQKFPNLC